MSTTGQRPTIGKHYRPSWFERRDRHGTYEALNAPMWPETMDLQKALLTDTRPPLWRRVLGRLGL